MVEKRYSILILILLFVIAGPLQAQRFNYDSHKKANIEYDENLGEYLRNDDLKRMRKVLKKDPSKVNSSSRLETVSKHKVLSGGKVPLLFEAVDLCLDGKCSVDMIELILSYKPNLYCSFKGKAVFYLILDYLAFVPTNKAQLGEQLFMLFSNQSGFDILQRQLDNAPPLQHLLTENYKFLGKKFSIKYISDDIIKKFIEKGASVNSRDEYSNSIFVFALKSENKDMLSYLSNFDVDYSIIDKSGCDAMFYAVKSNNTDLVITIINSDYPISLKRYKLIKLNTIISSANTDIINSLSTSVINDTKDMQAIDIFYQLFPSKRKELMSKTNFASKLDISRGDYPRLISMFNKTAYNQSDQAIINIDLLMRDYINKSGDLYSFIQAIRLYPFYKIDGYTDSYYKYESQSNQLISELRQLSNELPSKLKANLIFEAKNSTRKYYENSLRNFGVVQLSGLVNQFPSKKTEIYTKAYERFVKNPSISCRYTTTYLPDINSDIANINNIKNGIISFKNYFEDSDYIEDSNNKLDKCYQKLDELASNRKLAIQHAIDVKNSYDILAGKKFLSFISVDLYGPNKSIFSVSINNAGFLDIVEGSYSVFLYDRNGSVIFKSFDPRNDSDSFMLNLDYPLLLVINYKYEDMHGVISKNHNIKLKINNVCGFGCTIER